ncbi:hypothetical protein HMPREF1051_2666 [Neisseria sicca VK64]|uniref:Lipoprotein n=1 Tax=Neisseria sicca VK64 TaxID=1095748 RepID=I2NHI7_NEISI|nr:hypothetical protein HMPREF1051_2666 [Neisseria sicca VK64]
MKTCSFGLYQPDSVILQNPAVFISSCILGVPVNESEINTAFPCLRFCLALLIVDDFTYNTFPHFSSSHSI